MGNAVFAGGKPISGKEIRLIETRRIVPKVTPMTETTLERISGGRTQYGIVEPVGLNALGSTTGRK
jgi:hypothetical protein